jgi:hypothetical protein
MTISSIEEEFEEYLEKIIPREQWGIFRYEIVKSFYRQKFEEREREIIDIIIDWEKKLGGLKTKDNDFVNLTYLLGKISDFKK